MADIVICRKHGKNPVEARASAEHMAAEFKEEFDLNYAWNGEVLHFKRPGVSGQLTLDNENVVLSIKLAFFLSALKPSIEREVHKFFDENFQT